MTSRTNEDISNLSYRMSKQLDLAMNDLNNIKKNISEINTIVDNNHINNSRNNSRNNYERKIEEPVEGKTNINIVTDNETSYEHKMQDSPRAGFTGVQQNMSHNRWISSLRHPFPNYFY